MVTSVGKDVVTACAAIRAGLSRPRQLDYFQHMDEVSEEMLSVTGHPVRCLTEGFAIVGRWMRLASAAFTDLLAQAELPSPSDTVFWRETGLVIVAPCHCDERLGGNETTPMDLLRVAYMEPLRAALNLPIEHVDLLPSGAAGAIEAIQLAERWLTGKGLERTIILAADTYCEPGTLEWLVRHRRLKTSDVPVGLSPGEAGACFMLESEASARRRQARYQVVIEGVATGIEKSSASTEGANRGLALSEALGKTLAAIDASAPFTGDLVSDLNGETWRGAELAHACVTLAQRLGDFHLVLPAVSLGDCGAASGAVSMCIAVHALLRRYSRTDRVLVAARSEHGLVGTLGLRRGS
jgi:3-oxoacyl-[acyl-carrier-protein] synthase-1